eukprot:m.77670 g.77670  ORF g.77670 m.77670 type:complete len:95 (+) comp25039_c0_seq1:764-1048(+)
MVEDLFQPQIGIHTSNYAVLDKVVDPATNVFDTTSISGVFGSLVGVVYAPTTAKLYFGPAHATGNVLVADLGAKFGKWFGITTGKMYFCPHNFD